MASKSGKNLPKGRKGRRRESSGNDAPGFWDELPLSRRHLVVVCLLLALAAAFFSPAVFQGKELVGSDTVQSLAMAKSMVDHREETGEDPLWATNLFSGMPGYLILYYRKAIQLDEITRWARQHAWPVVQFIILILGVYVLVFQLTANPLAGLIAALAAGLTTYVPVILAVGHTSKFMAISWVPWMMAVFVQVLRSPRLIGAALFAAVLALELRSGHPQITYYAAWLLGLWWIVEGVSAFRAGKTVRFAKSTSLLFAGTVLAVLMVAQPYWAQIEYKQYSTRGGVAGASGGEAAGLAWDYAMNWSQGKAELLTLLVADLFGGGRDTYWGIKPFTEGPHYLGGIILFLAILAIIGRRSPVVRGLTVAVVVLTFFSLGKHLAWFNRPFFDYFPMFSAFRAPEMWLHMVELSLAVLAGIGAAYLVDAGDSEKRFKYSVASMGAVLGLALVLTFAGESMLSFERPNERSGAARQLAARHNVSPADPAVLEAVDRYMEGARASRIDRYKDDAIRTVVVLLIASLLLWLFLRGNIKSWALLTGMAFVVIVDLWGVGRRHLPDSSYVEGSAADQVQTYGFDRYVLDRVAEAGGPGHFRTLSLENSPVNWARPAYHYETPGGYNAAKLQVYQEFIDNVLFSPTTGMPTERGLDLTGTRFLIFDRELPGMTVVHRDPSGMLVLERSERRMRTGFVARFRVAETAADAFALLNAEDFDPSLEAVVATDPGLVAAPMDSASIARVNLVEYGPHEIIWDVETDAPRFLVTSEVYYPAGWLAYVDEVEMPIIQTNHAFRGVVIPAGSHRVRMTFDPASHRYSSAISIASTALVYGWLIVFFGVAAWRRRPGHSSAT